MSEKSGFFNAELGTDGVTYDKTYLADSFASYFARFIGNGVFVNPATQLQVTQNDVADMSIKAAIGAAFINGYWYENDTIITKVIETADGVTNRIDSIVLQFDGTSRKVSVIVERGDEYGDVAQPLAIVRNESIYELILAYINVPKGTTAITDAMITDMRSDSSVCGFVSGVVDQIDATSLFQQFQDAFDDWFDTVKNQLTADEAVQLQNQINGLKSVVVSGTLTVAGWTGASAPYSQTVAINGVTDSNNITLAISSNASAAQYAAAADAQLLCSAQGVNTITVKAFDTKPAVDIPFSVLILG